MFKLFLTAMFGVVCMHVTAYAIPDDGNRNDSAQNRISSYDACINAESPTGRSAADCAGESDIIGRREGLTEEQPGSSSGTTPGTPSKKSSKAKAEETRKSQKEAIAAFVEPTNSRHFSLGRLNSDKEALLVINNTNDENNVVFRVIRLIGTLVGTLAILLYIVAGYFMIVSQGDENALTKGKQIATFTSLGLVLSFTAYMIIQLIMGLMYFVG